MKPLGWSVQLEGACWVAKGVQASWFGGDDDPDDNGQTASGILTKDNPGLIGCALPIPGVTATAGTPLPDLPYGIEASGGLRPGGTLVLVSTPSKSLLMPLIDIGPALDTGHAIDLTQAAFLALGGDLDAGLMIVDYRVFPAALPKFV